MKIHEYFANRMFGIFFIGLACWNIELLRLLHSWNFHDALNIFLGISVPLSFGIFQLIRSKTIKNKLDLGSDRNNFTRILHQLNISIAIIILTISINDIFSLVDLFIKKSEFPGTSVSEEGRLYLYVTGARLIAFTVYALILVNEQSENRTR